MKLSDDGWQLCLALFTSGKSRSQESRFFALQVIDTKLGALSSEQLDAVKSSLFSYVSNVVGTNDIVGLGPSHTRNKLAQTLGYLFVLLYTSSWSSFFDDFNQLISSQDSPVGNPVGVDLYLRVLRNIHEEIGETIYSVSEENAKRNSILKDAVRQRDMAKLAASWQAILDTYMSEDKIKQTSITSVGQDVASKLVVEIIEGALKVVAGWVSWIDISLIVTPEYLNLIFTNLTVSGQRRMTACDTICEIVLKKMKAGDKLELISLLNMEQLLPQLPGMVNGELDFSERVAKLSNIVCIEALHIFDGSIPSNPQEAERAEHIVNTLFPVIIGFLSDEYDDVSQQVFPFISEYLQLLRRESKDAKKKIDTSNMAKNNLGKVVSGFPPDSQFVPAHRSNFMKIILEKIVVVKMKYDDDDDWEDQQDEDSENEFLHFRDKLKVFLDHVAVIDLDLYLEGMSGIITETLSSQYSNQSWQDVELGLYLLFTLGDSIRNANAGSTRGEDTPAQKAVNQLFLQMIQSDVVLRVNHPSVQKWYIELAVRHASVFTASDLPLVNKVLEMFVSPIGVHNSIEFVRVRSWYLFFRFIKQVKNLIGDVGDTVFNSISDLLVISAKPITSNSSGDDSDVDTDQAVDTVFSSQLYLFELCGLLVVHEANEESGVSLTRRFLQPLFSDIERCLNSGSIDPQSQTALQIHHDLYAIGTFIRGFSDNLAGSERPKIASELKNVTHVVSVLLNQLSSLSLVRDGARMVYVYLLPIAGVEIMSSITDYISVMLNGVSIEDIDDFLGFLGQLAHRFKDVEAIFEMFGSLISPLVNKTLTLLDVSVTKDSSSTDAVVQQEKIRRSYLQFLYNILNNGMGAIFIAPSNQEVFRTVLESVFHFAGDSHEAISIKLAVTVLNKMLLIWGTGTIAADPPESNCFCKGMEVQEPFTEEFMFERYDNLCFHVPGKPWFNSKDYQSRNVLAEVSLLQKTLYDLKGATFERFLGQQYLPNLGVSQELIVEYVMNLENLKAKEFRKFFTQFMTRG